MNLTLFTRTYTVEVVGFAACWPYRLIRLCYLTRMQMTCIAGPSNGVFIKLHHYLKIFAEWLRAATTAQVDMPLCPRGLFPIGYGVSGSPPSKFHLEKNQTLNVGYIRLFISTCTVNISSIAQLSPFTGAGRGGHIRKI
jgi:hypothetical protein